MNAMDVPSLVRQMQMNMMMPSLGPFGFPAGGISGGRSINGDMMNSDLIRATLGQPLLGQTPSLLQGPTVSSMQQIPSPQQSDTPAPLVGLPIQSQGIASSSQSAMSQGITSDNQVVAAEGEHGRMRQSRRQRRRDSRSSRSRSHRRRSSRNHRRHRESRRGRESSESELDVDSIRLPATHYLTRDFAKTDNIPSACLMIRKLPRVPRSLIESNFDSFIFFVYI